MRRTVIMDTEIISHQNDGLTFLEIRSEEQFINNVQDVLDLFGELYGQYYDGIILYERNITHDFFDLQTKLAGEILQKFSNYRIRLVIVGDWSKYTSRSLEAFICESNRGKTVNFSSSPTEAVKLLSRIN